MSAEAGLPGGRDRSPERTPSGWEVRNHATFVRFLESIAAGSRDAEVLRLDGVVAAVAPASPERSLFNSVAYEDPAALEAALDPLRKAYSEAGVRAWTVWVPEADEVTGPLLEERGHRLDAEPRQMRLELADVPAADEQLEFTRSADWEDLCAINDIAYDLAEGSFAQGFGTRPDAGYRAYGAHHEGFLASVLATIIADRDCGVFAVATLPEARGNHLAPRLLQRALLDARERGCTTSTLQSSPLGAPVYTRLGYRDTGGLRMWEHRVFA